MARAIRLSLMLRCGPGSSFPAGDGKRHVREMRGRAGEATSTHRLDRVDMGPASDVESAARDGKRVGGVPLPVLQPARAC